MTLAQVDLPCCLRFPGAMAHTQMPMHLCTNGAQVRARSCHEPHRRPSTALLMWCTRACLSCLWLLHAVCGLQRACSLVRNPAHAACVVCAHQWHREGCVKQCCGGQISSWGAACKSGAQLGRSMQILCGGAHANPVCTGARASRPPGHRICMSMR